MLYSSLEERLRQAVVEVVPDALLGDINVQPCPDAKFGDYQSNGVMGLAKKLKKNPRQLAAEVLNRLSVTDLCHSPEIAGAGFINFRLKNEAIANALTQADRSPANLLAIAAKSKTYVVDFSSPNVAKPMHVGHIRSTVLGDSIARTLASLGHRVIRDNHIGDWGTQFGKLIVGWRSKLSQKALEADPMAEMERLYKTVNAECEANPETLAQARQELKKLQDGDPANLAIWNEMLRWSQEEFDRLYGRLGIRFDHTLGESFYNPRLRSVVEDLIALDIARPSEGAMVVFFEDSSELKEHPALIRKSDGAANYTTTDLATVAYRLETWKPDEIVYVTDGRQQLHFKQLFAICQKWLKESSVKLTHVWFGSIMGEDGRPFRTRAGDTISLTDLLNEAEERAFGVVTTKNPDLPESERKEIARVVGIGAVKYADLLPNRQSDYVFSWDKMLSFNGNTAPYLQYAYARIRSIFRKVDSQPGAESEPPASISIAHPEERNLAVHLLNFGWVINAVAHDYRPNYLCTYLFELAGRFAAFYEACPVLKAEAAQKKTRLLLCRVTGEVLKQGLNLLGIETVERM